MGYDMYTVQGPDEQERAAFQKAQQRLDALASSAKGAAVDRDAWQAAWTEMANARRSYFRLNIWGMGTCREVMDAFGMLTDEPQPHFPDLQDYGLTEYPEDPQDYEIEEERAEVEAELTEAQRRYLDAVKAVTDADSDGGIPAYKFSSNDGWLVTPQQISAALATYQKADDADRQALTAELGWWPEWIAFLEHAKDRGGFRVY